jgi:hypothetical protein
MPNIALDRAGVVVQHSNDQLFCCHHTLLLHRRIHHLFSTSSSSSSSFIINTVAADCCGLLRTAVTTTLGVIISTFPRSWCTGRRLRHARTPPLTRALDTSNPSPFCETASDCFWVVLNPTWPRLSFSTSRAFRFWSGSIVVSFPYQE